MIFINDLKIPADWTFGFRRDGRELLIVMSKATYVMPNDGSQPVLADEQVELTQADRFSGEPGLSAPLFETDYAHQKAACDVLLVGSAYAPGGRPRKRSDVGLRVGAFTKQFAVVGDRHWRKRLMNVLASDPEPFQQMPLSYDVAFGGTDRTNEAEGRTDTYVANPVGRGYWRHASAADGKPLPNTEQLGHPADSHSGKYVPMAFSPIGRNWLPRVRYAGTYDQQWIENVAPLWPDDFDERYFQAAPPDQVIAFPVGGEQVVLKNLTPDGYCAFQLPTQRMPVTFVPHRGNDVTLPSNLDTLVFEPDQGRFTLTWRAVLPLGRSIFDVKETIVGERSPAWHRARRFPGKTYYANLAEAVRDRASKGRRP
ncbi:DUF2169 domain-containing protein [Caballeronia novacaledonica]|uniref:DUF2169 family type VI secretion system accessory protein n=1 Tax=Caballeronia novacaledonica TaxID=1544861 RepID=UPI001EE38F9D|nr:DUF2169 domain-containing protein [Caballeronia novacaledonica]GJH13236.1 DUF2169 domain-containing protein [Caballeronia novacaledonica]